MVGSMFIRRTQTRRTEDGKPYFSHRLVHAERLGSSVRQRTLLNLGRHFDIPQADWPLLCARINDALSGQAPLVADCPPAVEEEAQRIAAQLIARGAAAPTAGLTDVQPADVDSLRLVRPRSVGVEQVGLWALEQLDLPALLTRLGVNGALRSAATGAIVGRLAAPASERATHRWLQERSGLGELLGVDFETVGAMQLYRASDVLVKHREAIEAHLFDRAMGLFDLQPTVTLYDTFRPYVPDQSLLLPPDVREWLPEGHLAHHVSDLVDGLDLTAFYALYEGDGRRNAPYEPRMMVKVLLYAYATGVFSSRRVARKLEEDVGFRVLAAGNFPQHRTLCEFRRRHLEDFQALFVEVVRLAQELGLARLGKLSIDGTKVRANASKRKAMSYDRMQAEEQRLESEVEALLRQADAVDEAEDSRLGAEVRGDDLPAELRRREERLAAIREAKARLEAAARAADDARGRQPGQDRNPKGGRPYKRAYGEPDEKAQSNFTDPESSIMKTSNEGFQQCYNAQVTVDAEHQLVVATDLTANASDQGELPVLLDAVKETFAAQPETVLADAGYCNERDLTDLEKRGIDGYVALGREGKQTATRDREAHPATARMVEKLATPAGRTAYAERKWLSEAPNGWIKHVLGFRRFSLRGLAKVRCEWDLVCLALNVKRLQPLMAA